MSIFQNSLKYCFVFLWMILVFPHNSWSKTCEQAFQDAPIESFTRVETSLHRVFESIKTLQRYCPTERPRLLVNTLEYQVWVVPNLLIREGKTMTVRGRLVIPKAQISPRDFSNTLQLPKDIIFTDPRPMETVFEGPSVALQIQCILGNDVQIQYRGLSARLSGRLLLSKTRTGLLKAQGKLILKEGTYTLYGKALTIEKGELLFSGALDNPKIRLRATRTITTTAPLSPITSSAIPSRTVGFTTAEAPSSATHWVIHVRVSGFLSSPKIHLFSIPDTLSQADLLSFLILGRAMASHTESHTLLKAIADLNHGDPESSQLIEQVQQALGFNQFKVETVQQYDPTQNSVSPSRSLVIGQALSSRLFLSYNIGLMQSTNILKIRYFLNDHWSIQTETNGEASGGDILYHIWIDPKT